MVTKQEKEAQAKIEAWQEKSIKTMSNADKRKAVRYFDADLDEMDALDGNVWLVAKAEGLEIQEVDNWPMGDVVAKVEELAGV